VEVLYVSTATFLGSISDVHVLLEYNVFKHWGIGLGFNTFRFNFAAEGQVGENLKFEGSLKTGFTGLLLYGKYYF
jgi:hypothetical protein